MREHKNMLKFEEAYYFGCGTHIWNDHRRQGVEDYVHCASELKTPPYQKSKPH
jgi:hypothetical protein